MSKFHCRLNGRLYRTDDRVGDRVCQRNVVAEGAVRLAGGAYRNTTLWPIVGKKVAVYMMSNDPTSPVLGFYYRQKLLFVEQGVRGVDYENE